MMTSILTVAVLLVTMTANVFAAEEYTYKVTFYAGAQGTFSSEDDLSVEGSEYTITRDADKITVSGLKAGAVVSFNAQKAGSVSLDATSKYYVKGIRKSGRDNNTVEASAFRVTEDQDYVVAYGVKGNLTSYTVNYVDAEGNAIAESATYYGNVGDKPVVAYRYVEGYLPQAYGLTKTLSENTAENVFTFEYSRITTETVVVPGEGSGAGTGTGTETQPGTDEPGTDTPVDPDQPGTDTPVNPDQPGTDTPEVPDDVIDLDDEETPGGNIDLNEGNLPIVVSVGIGVLALITLIALVLFARKRRQ